MLTISQVSLYMLPFNKEAGKLFGLIFTLLLSRQEYQGSSVLGQFVTRFLLRETSTQLQSLQSSLDCAMEAVHDHGSAGRRILKTPEDLPIQRVTKRPSRRIQKNMCLSPTDPYSGMLTTGTFLENQPVKSFLFI